MMLRKLNRLKKKFWALMQPPPDKAIWQWAEENIILPPDATAEPGPYRLARTPYLKEIYEAVKDPEVEDIGIIAASQVAKTTFLLATTGYFIDQEPSPILIVLPTKDNAEDFSKKRIIPLIRDTPVLQKHFEESNISNTMLNKSFTGGSLTLVGANVPADLASKSIRVVIIDEYSRIAQSAGAEGDPAKLARRRTSTFYNRKHIYISSPTIKSECKITEFIESKKTKRYSRENQCPKCLSWIRFSFNHLYFDDEKPEDAVYVCQSCNGQLSEKDHAQMLRHGKWVDDTPDRGRFRVGFTINAFHSPWVTFAEIAREFVDSKHDVEKRKTFVNTYLAEPWEEDTHTIEYDHLYDRREIYESELPHGVILLTAGVDVQADRLECEVVGWGLNYESWSINYYIIYGNPTHQQTWSQLTNLLEKKFRHALPGRFLRISATCIDSGGHWTNTVYDYVDRMTTVGFTVHAVKGRQGGNHNLFTAKAKLPGKNKRKVKLFILGVDALKTIVYQNLQVKDPGPFYCHFPNYETYTRLHFKQLTAEVVTTTIRGTEQIKKWSLKNGYIRNEQLDCRVYATAAYHILNPVIEVIFHKIYGNDAVLPELVDPPRHRRKKYVTKYMGGNPGDRFRRMYGGDA